jgi:cytochrome c biogenesis protein
MSEQQKKSKDPVDRVVDFFASARLTLILIALIAVLSFLGTTGRWGFQDVYHTKYFTLLLGLLFTNLLICTIDRLPGSLRRIRMDSGPVAPPPPREPDYIIRVESESAAGLIEKAERAAFGPGAKTLHREMEKGLKREGVGRGAGKALVSFNSSARISIIGPHLTHLGILLIILGGIIGNVATFKGYIYLKPGQETNEAEVRGRGAASGFMDLGFIVRCNEFKVTWYEKSPMASDYLCDLSIIDSGKEAARKTIEVNQPLSYKGYGFYQSSYGPLIRLTAENTEDGTTVGEDVVQWFPWTVPGDTVSFMVVEFEERTFGMGRDMGPSVMVQKYQGGRPVDEFKLFQHFPDFDRARKDKRVLTFRTLPDRFWTGLQVIKDPGVHVVYAGFVLLTAGVTLTFFVFHRRVWLVVKTGEKFSEVLLIGRTAKAKGMFEKHLERIAERLKSEFGGELIQKAASSGNRAARDRD